MRFPDFIIIGAAKAGTTSLYKVLTRHPDIFMPTPKEPEFFARDDRYAAGIAEYARLFEAAAPDQICGEASTIYSLSPLFPHTAGRIRTHVPQAKLIYVLREPVARAYSYYVQLVKNRQNASQSPAVARSFEECVFPAAYPGRVRGSDFFAGFDGHLPDDPELFLAGSDYIGQIATYLTEFERSQIHFVLFEDFMRRPDQTLAGILSFLGVDPARLSGAATARANVSQDHFARLGETARVAALRRRLGPFDALSRRLPPGIRQAARQMLMRMRPAGGPEGHVPRPMLPETHLRLDARFRPDRPRITALTGLDLAIWDSRNSGS
jgi:hypothetical protein